MKAFVIMRDRVTYAQRCVDALQAVGLDVVIVDHDSQWPAAVDWLYSIADQVRTYGGSPRVDWDDNWHPRDLWRAGPTLFGPVQAHIESGERFIVTDCDVVPADDCPDRWVDALNVLLDENPHAVKAGLGLRVSDLPTHFEHADRVREWESQWQAPVAEPVEGGDGSIPAVWASIDTTLAMYRGPGRFSLGPAIRTSAPYEALHLPWYEDSANPTEEAAFYTARAEHGHWRNPDDFNDEHGLPLHERTTDEHAFGG